MTILPAVAILPLRLSSTYFERLQRKQLGRQILPVKGRTLIGMQEGPDPDSISVL